MTNRLASGAEVELRFGGNRTDRHGYKLAQVYVLRDGTQQWLQQELVKAGLARVYSFSDNRACVDALLAEEAEARGAKRGIWNSWAYRVLDATDTDKLSRLSHSYQLVEGVVAETGETAGRLYLNFTKDWRTDFTIAIESKGRARVHRRRHGSEIAERQTRPRPRLGGMAERAHDRGRSPRATRTLAGRQK